MSAAGPNSGDNFTDTFLGFAALFGLVIGAAYLYPFPFSWCWHWLARGEVAVLDWFYPILPAHTQRALRIIGEGLHATVPGSLPWHTIYVSEMSLWPFSGILYAIPILIVSFVLRRFSEPHHQRHTTETLIEVQTRVWRFSRMFVKHNPLKVSRDITKGPWRISETPEAFARRVGALHLTLGRPAEFDPTAALGPLRHQLGVRFTGLQTLARYEQWLAAPLLLRADGKKEDSDRLLGDISYHFNDEISQGAIERHVRKTLKRYEGHAIVERLTRRHAYVRSWLIGLFIEARACGKISTSQVPWLLLVDRTLFFALNNGADRRQFHMEGLAPAVHYAVEAENGFAVREPTDTRAAESVRLGLVQEGIVPAAVHDHTSAHLQPPPSAAPLGGASGGGAKMAPGALTPEQMEQLRGVMSPEELESAFGASTPPNH